MDMWHGLVALVALVGIFKWYIWCQMHYWYSTECQEDLKKENARDGKGKKHA